MANGPNSELAKRVLPEPLHRALTHVFAQGPRGCMLVGGTALAGYYAGHRRSDDLDLFVRDASALRATVLAVESLRTIDATLEVRQRTAQFFDATCTLGEHAFTVQVVQDENLFAVGESSAAEDGAVVATLATLMMQKCATLVSRCSEKDLYDLHWLLPRLDDIDGAKIVELGARVDAGMSAEAAVLSLVGAQLRQEACGFAVDRSPREVLGLIGALRDTLVSELDSVAKEQPAGPLAELVTKLRSTTR